MPYTAVTVTPTFTDDLSSLSINMPARGTTECTIPAGVTSFKVYDDGGPSGNYSNNCNGTLVLTAPAGYVLQLTGVVTMQIADDFLQVYDGNSTSATQLGKFYANTTGTATNIGTLLSSSKQLTLNFKSDGSINYSGLNLTVTLIDAMTAHAIDINTVEGGSVSATVGETENATAATAGSTVTLTASPSEGYMLSGITVTDENSNTITVTGGTFINNTATFTMPGLAVTVNPTFTNTLTADGGLYLNMPATGSQSVVIPAGVSSFKVYDDGGSAGNYSSLCNGTLVLTAPAGYVLQVSGTVTAAAAGATIYYDYLQVHDGSSTSATLLGKFTSTTNIGTLQSSGKQMTLNFQSNASGNYEGLNLTLTVVQQQQLTLRDNDDNTEAISDANGNTLDVTLSGRTLYKDGAWNTIVLPFDVALEGSPLAGAVARPLTSASISGTTLNLTFNDAVTTLEAGTPYIIKWESGDNIVSPVFNGVTIDATTRDYDNNASDDDLRVRFLGTYKSTTFDAEDKSILFMGGENTLYYPLSGASIGAQRAYFKIGDGSSLVKQFVLNFGDDEATGIVNVEGDSHSSLSGWFTLDGRRLPGKPTRAGVYINNGVKRVIK